MLNLKKLSFCIFALIFSVFLISCSSASSPSGITKKIIEHIYAGEIEKVISYIDIPEKDLESGGRELLTGKLEAASARGIANVEKKGGFDSVEIVSEDIQGDRATVKYKEKYKDGSQSVEQSMNFVKVDGKWKWKL